MEILAQSISIIAMILTFASYQCKKNKNLYIMQTVTGLLFATSFLLQGTMVGMFLNFTNVIRNLSLTYLKKKHSFWVMLLVNISSIIAMIIAHESFNPVILSILLSVFLAIAQFGATWLLWYGNGMYIRAWQFLVTSPAWLIYDIIFFNIGGILTELFNMISVTISIIRYGFNGFEK